LSKIRVEISELREKDGDKSVNDLGEFLEGKTNAKMEVTSGQIILNLEKNVKIPSKSHVRVLLKRFLHQSDLKEQFRVIAGKENVFIIKERKTAREEE
jgi:hypothetical protein